MNLRSSKFVNVFGVTAIMDGLWALYFKTVADDRIIVAGIVSALLIWASTWTFLSISEDRRLILAAMLGAFVGTVVVLTGF